MFSRLKMPHILSKSFEIFILTIAIYGGKVTAQEKVKLGLGDQAPAVNYQQKAIDLAKQEKEAADRLKKLNATLVFYKKQI